jgi:two-component system OmpR family sensor kinase
VAARTSRISRTPGANSDSGPSSGSWPESDSGSASKSRRTRYVVGVAAGVACLYTVFVLANTVVVGPTTVVPLPILPLLPALPARLYLQDVLDIVAAGALIAAGAMVLDRLLAHDQAVQTATLRSMEQVTATARRIGDTGEFGARVETPTRAGRVATPAAVEELAATFNAMLARLEGAFRAQRRLLEDTSHELRNPLTVLRTNLALLQRDDVDPTLRLDAARDADEEAARLGRLVDDLLLLGRGEARDLLHTRPERLDLLLADVAEEAQEAGETHPLLLSETVRVVVQGDRERLRQVLRNLVGNALRHTPAGTTIRLSLTVTDGWAEAAVADDGPGIGPEHLPRVFDRFYRADAARSRGGGGPGGEVSTDGANRAGGAGLGLSIAKHLVEAHGGTIALASAPGKGTVARVRLPTAPAPAE